MLTFSIFFFNDTATTEIYTLSLHDALPIATSRIEDLMADLKRDYTIVIVTHNMQQAARVSDMTAFLTAEVDEHDHRVGRLVEYDATDQIFTNPSDARTEGYITGRFG